jgi:hypothetical protein
MLEQDPRSTRRNRKNGQKQDDACPLNVLDVAVPGGRVGFVCACGDPADLLDHPATQGPGLRACGSVLLSQEAACKGGFCLGDGHLT